MDKLDGLVLREKEKSLHISRVPKKIKEEFTKYAEDEFAGDYGLLLRELWEKYKESSIFYQNFDVKLNYIIQLLEKETESEQEEKKPETKKMLSGRIVKGGIKNE